MKRFPNKDFGLLLVLIGITIVVYLNAFSIPFMGDEKIGLVTNRSLLDLRLFADNFSSWKGVFFRPLSNLSFAIDFWLWGAHAPWFHAVNLGIHILNIFLLWKLTAMLPVARLTSTAIFALHPLATACASQIFGRPYSLGSCWMLLSLILLLRSYPRSSFFMSFMAILSKQSFVLLPITLASRIFIQTKNRLILVATIFLSVVLAFFFITYYIMPLRNSGSMATGTYFISQLAHFWRTIFFYVYPFQLSVFHDFEIIKEINFAVFLGTLGWIAILGIIWRFRKQPLGWMILGWASMFIPTNSFVPKDQIFQEWRLYPSLIFFALITGHLFQRIQEKFAGQKKAYILLGIFIAWVCASGIYIYHQNEIYQDTLLTAKQMVAKYPKSVTALGNMGAVFGERGDARAALFYFVKAYEIDPNHMGTVFNIRMALTQIGRADLAAQFPHNLKRIDVSPLEPKTP